MSYHQGDVVTISAVWTNAAAEATDPAAVFAKYRDPSGNVETLTYGVDAALVRDSTGNYHVDVDADEAGWWGYRFYSTGTGQASSPDGEFYVFANEV